VLLGSDKASVDALLGPPVMAPGILGMTGQGEKAYRYSQAGDDVIVGFFDGIARYLAVVRNKGPKGPFSPAEMSSILALNGAPLDWEREVVGEEKPSAQTKTAAKTVKRTISPARPDTYFTSADQSVVGWQPGDKPFVFFLRPSYPGQPHLLLNEWQVARAIG
jgi:hypothetical protein